MSEILSGARYTLGGLVVLTLWTVGMVEFAQWKLDMHAAEIVADDSELLLFGPEDDASSERVRRYFDMVVAEKMKE